MQNIGGFFIYRPKLSKIERNKYNLLKKIEENEAYKGNLVIKNNFINDNKKLKINKTSFFQFDLSKTMEKDQILLDLKKKLNEDREKLINNRRIKEEEEIMLFKKIKESQSLIEKELLKKKICEKHEKTFKLKKLNINDYKSNQDSFVEKKFETEKNFEDNCQNEKMEKKYNFENKLIEIKKKSYLVFELLYTTEDIQKRIEYFTLIDEFINEEINFDKNKNERNLMTPEEAISSNNYINRFLGYFGAELLSYKIKNVYIEKTPSNEILRDIIFKIIIKELANQKVYKLTIVSPSMKKNIFKNIKNWYNLNELIKIKLFQVFNIPEDDIFFYNYNLRKFEVNMIIYNRKIDEVENVLKEIEVKVNICNVLSNIILSSNMFETKFCKNINEWTEKDGKRGGKIYYHPVGWIGLALKIKDKYDKYPEWLGKEGEQGEWAVAYHGVGKGNQFGKILNILNNGLKPGPNQFYSYHLNSNSLCRKIYCGKGVYFATEINVAENYAEKFKLGGFKEDIKFVIMARVNPYRTREPNNCQNNLVLNATTDDIRQYRLLVKIC